MNPEPQRGGTEAADNATGYVTSSDQKLEKDSSVSKGPSSTAGLTDSARNKKQQMTNSNGKALSFGVSGMPVLPSPKIEQIKAIVNNNSSTALDPSAPSNENTNEQQNCTPRSQKEPDIKFPKHLPTNQKQPPKQFYHIPFVEAFIETLEYDEDGEMLERWKTN